MADGLLEAVRGLRLANPELGPKPLLAKLREQRPDLGAGNKEVREALTALKAEREATEAAAAAPSAAATPPVAGEGGAPLPASLPPSHPLRAWASRFRMPRWRRASLASAAVGCRQRWATAG